MNKYHALIIIIIILIAINNKKIHCKEFNPEYHKMVYGVLCRYLKNNNTPYTYIFNTKSWVLDLNKKMYFRLKKDYFFVYKNYIWKTMYTYYKELTSNIIPKSYLFPEHYNEYKKECKNQKMILKAHAQKQQGLFVTTQIQPLSFINREKFIVAQKFIEDSLKYKNYKITVRLWFVIVCNSNTVKTFVYHDGLVYYSSIDNNIASFYDSYNLYDQEYPIGLKEFEVETKFQLFNKIVNKLQYLTNVIKKELKDEYTNDSNLYTELFGVDFHITSKQDVYILEVNKGPGMSPYIEKDKIIRNNMISDYINLLHDKQNNFIKL
jgi:Tubulin-tyrosine ligase family